MRESFHERYIKFITICCLFFCGSFVCLYIVFLFIATLWIFCWERAVLLDLVRDVYCIFVTFPWGILGQVWYLIVLFPDLCQLSYFSYLGTPFFKEQFDFKYLYELLILDVININTYSIDGKIIISHGKCPCKSIKFKKK